MRDRIRLPNQAPVDVSEPHARLRTHEVVEVPGPPDERDDAAEARYVRDLIARGEAAEPDEHGELPEQATHEIYIDEQGRRRVRRRHFFAE